MKILTKYFANAEINTQKEVVIRIVATNIFFVIFFSFSFVSVMKFSICFTFLILVVRGTLNELREKVRPISRAKQHIETLQANDSLTLNMLRCAEDFSKLVLDRQAKLYSSFSSSGEHDEETLPDVWRPDKRSSHEYVSEYVRRLNKSGFLDFLSHIKDIETLDEIDGVIEDRIIRRLEVKSRHFRNTIHTLIIQAMSVLDEAETLATQLLQMFSESEYEIRKKISEKRKQRETLSYLIERNKRIVDEIGIPLLPAVRTGGIPNIRFSETHNVMTWQAGIDNLLHSLEWTESDTNFTNRMKGFIRKLPLSQQNEARLYIEKKLVKNLENNLKKLDANLAKNQTQLEYLKIDQTSSLSVYSNIVVLQAWFAQIHY